MNIINSKSLRPDEIDFVIYHNPCCDGTGSAFVVWKYFSQKFPDKNITYHPATIGSPPPLGIEGKNVLICDYSYKKDIVIDLLSKVNKLLIIDHHKSAQKDLQDIDDKYKIFDMEHSGAMLTWFYFFPNIAPPQLIQYIEDRDIWAKKLPNTDDFASWFHTLPMEFIEYDKYLDDVILKNMIEIKGKSFQELNNYYTNLAKDYAIPKFSKIGGKYYFVAYNNSTVCKSDIGNILFDKFPHIDFSAIYSINDNSNSTLFSLRSTNFHSDVSEIAVSLGGGGHRSASGVKVNYVTNHLPGEIFDNGQIYQSLVKIQYEQINIQQTGFNIVYLNSTIYQYELAHYLLQTKYIDKDNKDIQVASKLLLDIKNIKIDKVHIAAIWNYDIFENKTHFTIMFHDSISLEEKKKMFKTNPTDLDKKIIEIIIDYCTTTIQPSLNL